MAYVVPSFVLAIVFNIPRYTQGRIRVDISQHTQVYTGADTRRYFSIYPAIHRGEYKEIVLNIPSYTQWQIREDIVLNIPR